MKFFINAAILALFSLLTLSAAATSESEMPEATEKFSGKNYMFLVFEQEKDGKRGYQIKFDRPKSKPTTEKFTIGEYEIEFKEYPFQPGQQTVLFHIKAKGKKEKRNLYVLFNGLLSMSENGYYFFTSEDRNKSIKYYSMYDGKPNKETIKSLLTSILKEDRQPLVATKWAANGKESEVISFDERLK